MNEIKEADARLLLDNLETCVCILRIETGEILYANRKAREEFGLDETPDKLCWQAFKGRERSRGHCKRCPRHTGDLTEGTCLYGEHRNRVTNKHYKNIGSLVTWNGERVHMQHFLDITEAKATEEALEKALESARRLNDAKSEFLSRMSHEIRTPMNAVIGMTKIAKQSDISEEVQNCLDNIYASAQQLKAIINDIFDISKIESRTLELVSASFNFKKTMTSVYEEFKKQAEEKKQLLTFHLDDTISTMYIGDEARLLQVAGNLLSNAVKFTPEGGRITFSAGRKKEQESSCAGAATVEVSVTDSGIGISKENIAKLFSPFEQLDGSKSRKYGGTGLGLVLSKNIVELMGGKIDVQSEEGKGSTFSFTAKFEIGHDLHGEQRPAGEPQKPKKISRPPIGVQAAEPAENEENKNSAAEEQAASFTDPSAFMPYINVKRGLENLKGNVKLYVVLLKSYLENEYLDRIEACLSAADFKEALLVAQALQNITVTIALDNIRGKMEMLEESLRGLECDDELLDKLSAATGETKKLIPDLILALEEGILS